jgi:hypothetical protein
MRFKACCPLKIGFTRKRTNSTVPVLGDYVFDFERLPNVTITPLRFSVDTMWSENELE